MRLTLSKRSGVWPFLTLALAVGIAAWLTPRTDLPPSYHHFADQRRWLGIPHFGDVASNLLFLLAGLCGLEFLALKASAQQFVDQRERWPYIFVFLGLLLTAFGSAYYHLTQTLGRCRSGILDPADAAETATRPISLSSMDDSSRDDGGHRCALESASVKG